MLDIFLYAFMTASFLGWIGYFLVIFDNYHKTPYLSKNTTRKILQNSPLISVIIPTRNESHRITKCIQTLIAQTYSKFEVIIIDDSTDDTIEVITHIIQDDKRFIILKQESLPPGWIGKPFALQQGSRIAHGQWLLFLDADAYYHPSLFEKAIEYALKNKLDMLSLAPQHLCVTTWEKIIQPIPLCAILGVSPAGKVNDPNSKVSFASGPFIMVKQTVFTKVNGYERIKGRIADDIELAKLIKSSGFRLSMVNAQSYMSVRMYEQFHDIWDGWSKNSFLGFIQKREIKSRLLQTLLFFVLFFAIIDFLLFPFLCLITSLFLIMVFDSLSWTALLLYSAVTWVVSMMIIMYIQRVYRISKIRYAPLILLLGGSISLGIFTNSALRTILGKGVIWKGRMYPIEK